MEKLSCLVLRRIYSQHTPRGVVDTSVLVAGIAGLKTLEIAPKNPSAELLREWIESNTFVWLITDEIFSEYKQVLARLGVRRSLIGKIVNLLLVSAGVGVYLQSVSNWFQLCDLQRARGSRVCYGNLGVYCDARLRI
jgi:predicted nucleic acid-binding protein